ncbi:MAG: hypothetical protein LUH10_11015 [Tannerellaceae bacterium]|nr:hypothetical protein [Tannerellaceae bacterium]
MKIKSLFFASALLAAAFTGCNKEEGVGNGEVDLNGETTSVKIQLSEATGPETKAITDKVGDGTAVTFNDGYLLFVNQNNYLTTPIKIVNGTPDPVAAIPEVSYTTLTTTGEVISDVLSSSRKVYFIGNLPAGITIPPVNTDLTNFLSTPILLSTQWDGDGGVKVVSLYGEGGLTLLSDAQTTALGYAAVAEFDVYPLMSRIEIEKFAVDATGEYADDGTTPSTITGFDIEAIYVNYFYSQTAVNGTIAAANQVTYSANATWYPGSETYYSAPYDGLTYDFSDFHLYGTGIGEFDAAPNDDDYIPLNGKEAWAYNVFANGDVAHVIVRLTNIQGVAGITPTDIKYLTIRGFNNNGTSLTGFVGGEIYTIDELFVHEDKLTDRPEEEDYFNVKVTVNMMKWTEVAVKPEY